MGAGNKEPSGRVDSFCLDPGDPSQANGHQEAVLDSW